MKEHFLHLWNIWLPFIEVFAVGSPCLFFGGKYLHKKLGFQNQWISILYSVVLSVILIAMLIISAPINQEIRTWLLKGLAATFSVPVLFAGMNPVKNIIGGFFLHLKPSFKPGHIIKINGVEGWVMEVGIMKTVIKDQYVRNVHIPNKDFSDSVCKVVDAKETIIYAELSLGYDANSNIVTKALMKSAEDCGLEKGAVWVKKLGNNSISYEIRAFLKDTNKFYSMQSQLKMKAMQNLHQAKIEVLSPEFINIRRLESDKKILHNISHSVESGIEEQERESKKEVDAFSNLNKMNELLKKEQKEQERIKEELSNMPKESDLEKCIQKLEEQITAIKKAVELNKESKDKVDIQNSEDRITEIKEEIRLKRTELKTLRKLCDKYENQKTKVINIEGTYTLMKEELSSGESKNAKES